MPFVIVWNLNFSVNHMRFKFQVSAITHNQVYYSKGDHKPKSKLLFRRFLWYHWNLYKVWCFLTSKSSSSTILGVKGYFYLRDSGVINRILIGMAYSNFKEFYKVLLSLIADSALNLTVTLITNHTNEKNHTRSLISVVILFYILW